MSIIESSLLKKEPMFCGLWGDADDVFNSFRYSGERSHLKILYAEYDYVDYSGSAYVLGYDSNAESFFEVYGSHCSCYGLEDQWSEEHCTINELNELCNRRWRGLSQEMKDWLK